MLAGHTSPDLDYRNTASLSAGTSIKDIAGNNAMPGSGVDLGVLNAAGPFVTSSQFQDANSNGLIDLGDKVFVTFNENINAPTIGSAQFHLHVSNDDFGSGAP